MRLPDEMDIPLIPLSRRPLLAGLPNLVPVQLQQRAG